MSGFEFEDVPVSVVQARAAAEAVRGLNHSTMPGVGRLVSAPDVDAVVVEVARLAARLPQALRQVAAVLDGQAVAGRVGDDRGCDVVDVVAQARDRLGLAALAAQTLADRLDGARQCTAHLFEVSR